MVFFTGDNGTGGDGKGQTTERGARVPMIVNGPGIVKPIGLEQRAGRPVRRAAHAGRSGRGRVARQDHPIDGHSFAPLLAGRGVRRRGSGSTPTWATAGSSAPSGGCWRTNSPNQHFGRLYDCGTSRDGSGYRDVTDSTEPEVAGRPKDDVAKSSPTSRCPKCPATSGPTRVASPERRSEASNNGSRLPQHVKPRPVVAGTLSRGK